MGGDSYYEILGVRPDASFEEIRTKYRNLIRRIHPDLDGPVALFRQVQEAYEVLSDPVRRADYDRVLAARRRPAGVGATRRPPSATEGARRSSATNGSGTRTSPGGDRSCSHTRGPVFRSFPSQNPAGAVALAGTILVVLGAAFGHARWILFGFGCLGLLLGILAGLGRFGTRKLGAYQRSGMAAIDAMSGREFEDFLGELFLRKGYRVARLGGRGDGSASLLLDHAGGPTIVQVKRWAATVDHETVQKAAAAMGRFRATRALVVTSSTYSPRAITYANSCGVTLWNRAALAAELAAIQGEQSSTGTRRLVSDVRAGGRVCLGVWVTALVALAVASRRVHRTRPTTRN